MAPNAQAHRGDRPLDLRLRPSSRALTLALALDGCAATIDGSAGRDGGADVVAPQRDCAWRALPAVEVSPPGEARYRLVDAVATRDGAWVVYRARRPARDDDDLYLARVSEAGEAHPALPAGSVNRASILGLASSAALRVSMVAEGERVAVLASGATDRGECVWSLHEGAIERTVRSIELGALAGGFALAGCQSMLRARGGYSFVSEQVRALWGTTQIELDSNGVFVRRGDLPMTTAPSQGGMSRLALDDGDFLGSWISAPITGRRESSLEVRRFNATGEARGALYGVASTPETLKDHALVRAREGLLALWEGPADRFPASDALNVRALSLDGAPLAEARALTSLGFFLGGLSAASRGDEFFATALTAREGMRLEFLVLDPTGGVRAQVDTRLSGLDGPLRLARVTATPLGALVFATIAQGERGGRVVAVPMRCE